METRNLHAFSQLALLDRPAAQASLEGGKGAPKLSGTVRFYRAGRGTLVIAEVFSLPSAILVDGERQPAGPFYAFHIHEGEHCGDPDTADPFAASHGHYNPGGQPHPLHAGDLPPLLGNNGYAYMSCYTERFRPEEVVGRTIIVHQKPDDFRTQPSGDAGQKLGCGVIRAL